MGRRTTGGGLRVVVAAVVGFVGNYRKEERSLSGEHQVGGSCRESGSHDRAAVGTVETDRRECNESCFLSISQRAVVCASERETLRSSCCSRQSRNCRGFSPLSSLFSRWLNRGPFCPPFQIQQACLSLLTKAPLFDARCPLGMLGRSRRVRQTATLHTRRSIADSTSIGMIE